jgi:hypothetical protein
MINLAHAELITNQLGFGPIIESIVIQDMWSGYGKILRFRLDDIETPSVILKEIKLLTNNEHPKGWNTNRSHLRKIKSYEIEQEWYAKWANQCDTNCRVPNCYFSKKEESQQLILLEDLNTSGYPQRRDSLKINEAKVVLKWLANFHAIFMNSDPDKLWDVGTYWHLATRPDEWEAMKECELKSKALEIDQMLSSCQYKTIVHGDAKVANFCFAADMKEVAAVDFQYVGGGCGIKDVAYFLGSCLSEQECKRFENELLDYYFEQMANALSQKHPCLDAKLIEQEWRSLFPIAWADFTRFLLGWSPSHQKLNNYSKTMVEQALELIA